MLGPHGTAILDVLNDPSAPQLLSVYDPADWAAMSTPFFGGDLQTKIGGTCGTVAGSGGGNNWKTIFTADQETFVDLAAVGPGGGDGAGLWLRGSNLLTTSPLGYELDVDSAGAFWAINVNGNSLGRSARPVVGGDSIAFSAIGSLITAYHSSLGGAWSPVLQVVDSTVQTPGLIALFTVDAITRFRNFGGGQSLVDVPQLGQAVTRHGGRGAGW